MVRGQYHAINCGKFWRIVFIPLVGDVWYFEPDDVWTADTAPIIARKRNAKLLEW